MFYRQRKVEEIKETAGEEIHLKAKDEEEDASLKFLEFKIVQLICNIVNNIPIIFLNLSINFIYSSDYCVNCFEHI